MATAYDYQKQCWIEGEDARQLLLSQVREEIDLLTGRDGEAYAKMLNADRDDLLIRRRAELASLETIPSNETSVEV